MRLRVSCGLFILFSASSAWADSLAGRDFNLAKALFESGKENEALVSMTDFLRKHPDDALANEAQFYVGEIYFHKRQFDDAITEFRKVGRYHGGARVPDAYLRIGEAQMKLGNMRAALIEFEAVRRRFPKTPQYDKAQSAIDGLLNPEKVQ